VIVLEIGRLVLAIGLSLDTLRQARGLGCVLFLSKFFQFCFVNRQFQKLLEVVEFVS